MSHTSDVPFICPSCNYHAERNYCAECGQPVHLHKETFWGLIGHFFAHYLHYESKFWQTLIALWTKPGKLTIAYLKNQRTRYTAPMSLYIFIVAAVTLITLSVKSLYHEPPGMSHSQTETVHTKTDRSSLSEMVAEADEKAGSEKVEHSVDGMMGKIAFFMVPVMALLVGMFFFRNRAFDFVDHIIFSLHVHAFLFSTVLFIPELFSFSDNLYMYLVHFLHAGFFVYMVMAMRNVYHIKWMAAILYTLVAWLLYLAVFSVILISVVLFLA